MFLLQDIFRLQLSYFQFDYPTELLALISTFFQPQI